MKLSERLEKKMLGESEKEEWFRDKSDNISARVKSDNLTNRIALEGKVWGVKDSDKYDFAKSILLILRDQKYKDQLK